MEPVTAGDTSVTRAIFIQDVTSAIGGGLAGLTHATGGLVAEYRRRNQNSWTAITLVAGTLGTWSSGAFVADGALDGAYEIGLPNAMFTAGTDMVYLRLRGATNMLPVLYKIPIHAVNYQDGVRAGLTALPNAAANSNSGLPIRDTVLDDILSADTANYTGIQNSLGGNVYALQNRLPADPADQSDVMNALTVIDDLIDTEIGSIISSLSTITTNLSTVAGYVDTEIGTLLTNVSTLLTNLSTVSGYLDTEVAAILAAVDTEIQTILAAVDTEIGSIQTAANAIKAVTDKLDTALEQDGAVYRYTINALEQAPSGGGGGGTLYGEDGSITFTYTVYETDGTTPLPLCAVYVSADLAGTQRSQTKLTDSLGRVTFDLDPGTVYFWRSHPNFTFTNPDSELVGA